MINALITPLEALYLNIDVILIAWAILVVDFLLHLALKVIDTLFHVLLDIIRISTNMLHVKF